MSRKAYFNEVAQIWDQKYLTPELMLFLTELLPRFDLKSGQKILDLGSGTGVLIPFLSKALGPTGSITAIDYAEKMIQEFRSKYSHLKNVTIKLQDVEELDIPSESFDAITCFGLFPHLENKEQALYHMHRVLKTGGRLIIAHALSSAEINAHHHNTSPAVIHDMLPEKHEMRQLLEHAGFIDIYIKDEPGCYLCLSSKS